MNNIKILKIKKILKKIISIKLWKDVILKFFSIKKNIILKVV